MYLNLVTIKGNQMLHFKRKVLICFLFDTKIEKPINQSECSPKIQTNLYMIPTTQYLLTYVDHKNTLGFKAEKFPKLSLKLKLSQFMVKFWHILKQFCRVKLRFLMIVKMSITANYVIFSAQKYEKFTDLVHESTSKEMQM